jgi:hypothetical protein
MLRRLLIFVILPILLLASYVVAWQVLTPDQRKIMGAEMGPLENIGTLLFLLSGIVGLALFFRSKDRAPIAWRCFYLLYAMGAFFIVAEEVSYGQHLLNFNSPAYFQRYSKQKEVNLHNLYGDAMSKNIRRVAQIGVPIVAVIAPLVIRVLDRRAFTPGHWPFYTLPLWEVAVTLLLADLCYFIHKREWFGITDIDEATEALWGLACLMWIAVLARRVVRQPASRADISEVAHAD